MELMKRRIDGISTTITDELLALLLMADGLVKVKTERNDSIKAIHGACLKIGR